MTFGGAHVSWFPVEGTLEPRCLQVLWQAEWLEAWWWSHTSRKIRDLELTLPMATLPETNSSPMKTPMFPCKYHQKGGFSMAMLVLGRLTFWTFGDSIFSRENKPFKLFFQGPGRLSEGSNVSSDHFTLVVEGICWGWHTTQLHRDFNKLL